MQRVGLGRVLLVTAGCLFLATGNLASQEVSFSTVTLDNPTPQTQASFGRAVAGVGDVNADGVSDLLVGAPAGRGRKYRQGRVFLFLSVLTPSEAIEQLIAEVLDLNLETRN